VKRESKLPTAAALLMTPLAAQAQSIPHIVEAMYAFGGGLLGGLVGALLACWLCNRRRGSKDDTDSKRKY
jgi:hypothetical protein